MKKTIYYLSLIIVLLSLNACANTSKNVATGAKAPKQNKHQWITLFDGTSLEGWRGYNRKNLPKNWSIEDGALKVSKTEKGEDSGDIIFDRKFKNFELSFEWKVSKGANSGIFYLAQEIPKVRMSRTAPEYQILDNANNTYSSDPHPAIHQSASLYDMIPASPQNSKPLGEWNTGGIIVYKGNITHIQNKKNVVKYQLWSDHWREMVAKSKFKGLDYFINIGGENKEGFIGLQDHKSDVWYRNIKIKILD